jgi:hypothetical protein
MADVSRGGAVSSGLQRALLVLFDRMHHDEGLMYMYIPR